MNHHAPIGGGRSGWLKRLACSIGTFAALFTGPSVPAASSQSVAETGYRPAAAAPETWRAFASQLQSRFQQRLAAADEDAWQFQDYLARRTAAANASPAVLTMRTWISPDGKVERIEFDGLDDPEVELRLRTLFAGDVGAPPADMLQPLRMRLSLRPDDPPRQEK
jgi:hypothetical protein